MRTHILFRLVSALTLSVFLCQSTVLAQPELLRTNYLARRSFFPVDSIPGGNAEQAFEEAVRGRLAAEGDGLQAGDGLEFTPRAYPSLEGLQRLAKRLRSKVLEHHPDIEAKPFTAWEGKGTKERLKAYFIAKRLELEEANHEAKIQALQ